jgi:hypothetical protein
MINYDYYLDGQFYIEIQYFILVKQNQIKMKIREYTF